MADDPRGGIDVGDAVLTFIGDTQNLEKSWTDMQQTIDKSATETVNKVLKLYDQLGIEGSTKLIKDTIALAQAYDELKASGVASLSDLLAAEIRLVEAQQAAQRSLGEVVSPAATAQLTSLKLQYIAATGSVEEFEAAQLKSAAASREAASAEGLAADAAIRQTLADIAAAKASTQATLASKEKAAAAKEGSGIGGALAGLGSTAGTLAMYAGIAAVAGALAEGAEKAIDFEGAFTELTSILDSKTPEGVHQIELLKAQILELPPALGDVTALTHAMYDAISSGVPAGQAIGFVTAAAKLARASLSDIPSTVRLLAATLNAYGISANDAEKVTSALFQTINVGVTRGPELAQSLGQVIPIAAGFKVSIQDALGAVAGLTLAGLDTAESVTALKQVIVSIFDPSKDAKKAFDSIGVSFRDLQTEIQTQGLAAGLQTLADKTNGNTEATGQLFGNVRALNGVLALSGPVSGKYRDALTSIKTAYDQGSASTEAFTTITSGAQGQLQTLGNTISQQVVVGFEKLKPLFDGMGTGLTSLIINSGLLKSTLFLLVSVVFVLAESLSGIGIVIEGLKVGTLEMAKAFVLAAGYITGFGKLSDNAKASIASLQKGIDDGNKSLAANQQAAIASRKAFEDLAAGVDKSKQTIDKYGASAKASADAQGAIDEAARKASQSVLDAAAAAARHTNEMKDQAAAAAKATKAMDEYAKSTGVVLVSELQAAADKAHLFALATIESNAPLATQNTAILAFGMAVSKLKSALGDGRSIGELLFDQGKGKDSGISPLIGQIALIEPTIKTKVIDPLTGQMSEVDSIVFNPLQESIDKLLAAEQELGITGTATLMKHFNDATEAAKQVRLAWSQGIATAAELSDAEAALAKANDALAGNTSLRQSMQNALVAERELGIQGTAYLTQHKERAQDAFNSIKDAAGNSLEPIYSLQRAELELLATDIEMKTQAGVAIPPSELTRYRQLSDAVNVLDTAMRKNISTTDTWFSKLEKGTGPAGNSLKRLSGLGQDAFSDFSSSFGSMVTAIATGQKGIGEAFEDAVATTLIAVASQAAVLALYNVAEGFAALANPLTVYLAPGYFHAAAEYAGVAVVAGAAGALMGGGNSGGNGGGAAGASGSSTTSDTTNNSVTSAAPAPVQATNVQHFATGGLVSKKTMAIIGDSRTGGNATEAALPLDDPKAMATVGTALAMALNGAGGGGGTVIHVQGLISPDNLDKVIGQMNRRVDKGVVLKASHATRTVRKS